MGLKTLEKRDAAMRILLQLRTLRVMKIWRAMRHKKTPNVTLLTNNHVEVHLKHLQFSATPNQLFTSCCERWQPSSAHVPALE